VVHLACQGTIGERYIEGHQYQLDDSETNEPVEPSRFAQNCLEDGKAFEVTMKLIRKESVEEECVELDICPRCDFHHQDEKDRDNEWIRWCALALFALSRLTASSIVVAAKPSSIPMSLRHRLHSKKMLKEWTLSMSMLARLLS
jgi:hypothetical protein